jgi:flagellar hook-associated protein 1 FlgK
MATSTDALSHALAGLQTTKSRIDTVSRNVANASTDGYTRKTQDAVTGALGNVFAAPVRRQIDDALLRSIRESTSAASRLDVTATMLSRIETAFGSPDQNGSLSGAFTELQTAFHDLAISPQKSTLYQTVIDRAGKLSTTFNHLYTVAEQVRLDADTQIAGAVGTVNQLLDRLQRVNSSIASDTSGDTTDLEDEQDRLLNSLSEQLDIVTFKKANGAVAVYSRSGTQLVDVDVKPLSVSNIAAPPLAPLAPTKVLIGGGRLGGLLAIRDQTVPQLQSQLDDMARAVTQEFQGIGVELFNDAGGTPFNPAAVPPAVVTPLLGYASRIKVNNAVVANPLSLRDGTPTGSPPVAPPPLDAGDTTNIDRAFALFQKTTVAFTASTGLPGTGTFAGVAAEFIAGAANARSSAADALEYEKTLKQNYATKLSTIGGVNVDDEMAQLLQLQQAYAANARIIQAAKDLTDELLAAVR